MRRLLTKFMTSERLLARCARGGAVLGAGTVVERGARFVRNMILARILAPDQFGVMALVMAAGGLLEVFTEVGVREAIVQSKRGDSEGFLNIAWWFNAVRGTLLYLLGLAVVPWIAQFYREPLLESLLKVSFLTMLCAGLTSTRLYALQKNLQFGRYVWITQGSGVAGTLLSLVMALFIPNVWALVAGFVSESAFRCIASFLFCSIRPRLTFEPECVRELVAFARGMFGLPLLTFVVMQTDVFVLGRVVGKDTLGMYSLAMVLASTPQMVFNRVVQPLVLPVLAGFKGNTQELRDTFVRMTELLFTFGIPLAMSLAVFSRPLLSLVYGETYTAISMTFGLLCGYTFCCTASTLFASTYMAIGKPGLHRRFMVLWMLLVVSTVYPAAVCFGPIGVAVALWLCLVAASAFQVRRIGRIIHLTFGAYLKSIYKGVLLGAVIGAIMLGVRFCAHLPQTAQVGVATVLCLSAWALGARGLGRRLANPTCTKIPAPCAADR